jgi:hypothetical protein
MRKQSKFAIWSRSQERSFFTEAQVLKLVRPRSQDDLISVICATPNSSIYTTPKDAATTELSAPLPLAQKASA